LDFSSLLFFCLAVIGLTNIIVDPATIMQPLRDFIEKRCHPWINKLVSCYQCSGTWVGFFCGYLILSKDPFIVFLSGMAGSFLATFSAIFLTYLEARSIVDANE
jgi:hypothetical protein